MKVGREVVEANRKRILEAAGRLFRERGFEGVTVAQVMQAAGLTHGGFYGYFTSKDDLIAQTLHELMCRGPVGDLATYAAAYLAPEMEVSISLHEGNPVAIELPPKAVLEVVETEPAMKGQTASSSYKPAVLSNGVRTSVPPFITTGTKIVVMTADGSYVERAK